MSEVQRKPGQVSYGYVLFSIVCMLASTVRTTTIDSNPIQIEV
jgi:hypothetical protein